MSNPLKEFNERHPNQFRFTFVELEKDSRWNFFQLEQWCPLAQKWAYMLLPQSNGSRNWHFRGNRAALEGNVQRFEQALQNLDRWIILNKDKHGTYYYDASSTEAIGLACLDILRRNQESGYYHPVYEEPKPPGHKPEELNDEILKTTCERQWRDYDLEVSNYEEEKIFFTKLAECLETNDYYLAFRLVDSRCDYEYEEFSMESLQPVHFPKENP